MRPHGVVVRAFFGHHITQLLLFFLATLTASAAPEPEPASPPKAEDVFAVYGKGHTLWQSGYLAKAIPHVEEAVVLAIKVFGTDDLTTADLHNRLGLLYYHTSQFALAEAQFQKALAIRQEKLGKEHPLVGECLNNLSIQFKEQGQYARAEEPLRQALAIQKKIDPEHATTADFMDNVGFLLLKLNRQKEAGDLFQEALAIRRKAGQETPEVAQSIRNLAEMAEIAGKYDEARKYYQESLKTFEKTRGPRHRKVAISLNSLAGLELAQGRPEKALPLLEQCLEIQRANTQTDDPEVSVGLVLDNCALTHGRMGNWKQAATALDEAMKAYLRYVALSLPSQPDADQLVFLETAFKPTLHRGLSLVLSANDDRAIRALSANWVLNGKGLSHRTLAERALLVRSRQTPQTAKLAQELLEVREERSRLHYFTRQGIKDAELPKKRSALMAREQDLIRQLGEQRGRIRWDGVVELDAVRAALAKDSVLIEIARFPRVPFEQDGKTEEVYAAWVIPPRGKGDVRVVHLGPAEPIDEAAWKVRDTLRNGATQIRLHGEEEAEKQAISALDRLSDLVLKPLLGSIGSSSKWIISPDADLWLVPWAALRLSTPRYAVEQHEILYTFSGRDLLAQPEKVSPTTPLVFADPDFDFVPPRAKLSKRTAIHWDRLPGTAEEARAVIPALTKLAGKPPRVFQGREAVESAFKQAGNPRVLVLSTHGFFLEDRPPAEVAGDRGMKFRPVSLDDTARHARPRPATLDNPLERCALIFAGANNTTDLADEDDGMLTGLEIVGVDLRGTELVVLSACETGIGRVHRGEGVAGLRQAFLLAGASGVMATLWKVPDRETALLVSCFFDRMANGEKPTSALRSAQLEMIEGPRERNNVTHPYYWAAFTLTGR